MSLAYVELVPGLAIRESDCGHGVGVIAMQIASEYDASCLRHCTSMPPQLGKSAHRQMGTAIASWGHAAVLSDMGLRRERSDFDDFVSIAARLVETAA
ncbi:MAG TPA: hypothetical protein VHI95_07155 [Acidimicrobiales bacterium]|nr:hypothetical protein [Acidimicrobiales bacterium]